MLDQIMDTMQKYNMLNMGDRVVVALSGGADSVSLLLSLSELSDRLGITVSAIHVNHCLRGDESDSDETFCKELCKKNRITLISKRFDVLDYALKNKMSVEQAARNIRYDFFKENTAGKKLATAHTANDNAETVIFNLTRGTGIKGIAGIPPVRDNIIRPLIETTRQQVEDYLSEKNQNFVTDKTNLSDDYTRNKIRHNVIPVLEMINSSLFRTITADSYNFRLDNSYLEEQSVNAFNACHTDKNTLYGLNNYHKAIRHRCISMLLSANNIDISQKRISDIDIICTNGGKINLHNNVYIVCKMGIISIEDIHPSEHEDIYTELKTGSNKFMNKEVIIFIRDISEKTSGTIIDADKLSGKVVLRNRRAGDKIQFKGNNFTSSVKKIFNEKFSLQERDQICFIADESGPVFIEKAGISERVKVTHDTKRVMEITIHCE